MTTTVKRAKQLKEQLEDELLDLIVQYEKETGLKVNSVIVHRWADDCYAGSVLDVDCVVEL